MDRQSSFLERLKLGNDKEVYVCNILKASLVPCELNNKVLVTDMDLYLPKHKMYMDVKYLESTFEGATDWYDNMTEENCLIISKDHVNAYENKRISTGNDTWVCFLVNYLDFNVYELRFIRTEDLLKLVKEEKAFQRFIKSGKNKIKAIYNLNKDDCLDMRSFLNTIA